MPATKTLKTRIKSVQSTGKLTKAMEMIASINMRRAIEEMEAMTPFALQSWETLNRVSISIKDLKSPLFHDRKLNHILIILVAGNRGLCGAFYSQLQRKIHEYLIKKRQESPNLEAKFIVIGKKGEKIAKNLGGEILASFIDISDRPGFNQISPIFDLITEQFKSEAIDQVIIFYTDFVNTLAQKPVGKRLLPITDESWQNFIKEILGNKRFEQLSTFNSNLEPINYVIEPNYEEVIEAVFGMLLRAQIFQALIESKSSIEAARMTAMSSASDNAEDMEKALNLVYNQIRQNKITQELAEIGAGSICY